LEIQTIGKPIALFALNNQARKTTNSICKPTVGVKVTNIPIAAPSASRHGGSLACNILLKTNRRERRIAINTRRPTVRLAIAQLHAVFSITKNYRPTTAYESLFAVCSIRSCSLSILYFERPLLTKQPNKTKILQSAIIGGIGPLHRPQVEYEGIFAPSYRFFSAIGEQNIYSLLRTVNWDC
jgi:hypothetical protein